MSNNSNTEEKNQTAENNPISVEQSQGCLKFHAARGHKALMFFPFSSTDKPEVKIVVEFPVGLTREGENLELTCQIKGKPE